MGHAASPHATGHTLKRGLSSDRRCEDGEHSRATQHARIPGTVDPEGSDRMRPARHYWQGAEEGLAIRVGVRVDRRCRPEPQRPGWLNDKPPRECSSGYLGRVGAGPWPPRPTPCSASGPPFATPTTDAADLGRPLSSQDPKVALATRSPDRDHRHCRAARAWGTVDGHARDAGDAAFRRRTHDGAAPR